MELPSWKWKEMILWSYSLVISWRLMWLLQLIFTSIYCLSPWKPHNHVPRNLSESLWIDWNKQRKKKFSQQNAVKLKAFLCNKVPVFSWPLSREIFRIESSDNLRIKGFNFWGKSSYQHCKVEARKSLSIPEILCLSQPSLAQSYL